MRIAGEHIPVYHAVIFAVDTIAPDHLIGKGDLPLIHHLGVVKLVAPNVFADERPGRLTGSTKHHITVPPGSWSHFHVTGEGADHGALLARI